MRALLISVVLVAAGCQKAPSGAPPVTEAQAAKIAETAEASFTTGDVKAIMSQYGDKAVMIDAASPNPSADRVILSGLRTRSVTSGMIPFPEIFSATAQASRIPMLEYWYFVPGENSGGSRSDCEMNSASGACRPRRALLSGN